MDQTRLAIVGYPALDKFDLRWIAELRGAHDPQALRIGPHFTLVFPFQAVASEIAAELQRIVRGLLDSIGYLGDTNGNALTTPASPPIVTFVPTSRKSRCT
jgi:hypothetical protein